MKAARKLGVSAIVVVIVSLLAAPVQARIEHPSTLHTLGISVWLTSGTATGPFGTGTWSSTLWSFDYRASLKESPWGLRLNFTTGSQGGFGGAFAGASGGTDRIWSVDASYQIPSRGSTFWAFAGYASYTLENSVTTISRTGLRFGVDWEVPLQLAPGGRWSIRTRASTGAATDLRISALFEIHSKNTSTPTKDQTAYVPASFTLLQHDGGSKVELGYDWSSGSGSDWTRSGVFLSFMVTF